MARNSDRLSRRTFIATTAAAGSIGVTGCAGNANTDIDGDSGSGGSDGSETTTIGTNSGPLKADGSSTVYPITNLAASYWNSNPPASDEEYWGPDQYDIQTDEALAEYWAGLYGFTSGDGGPPFQVTVGLSHSGTGIEKIRNGQVDIGDSSAPVEAELPEASEEELSKFTDHVVGVDAQPIVVSKAIYDSGVTKITIEELRGIYQGDITNWSELGGPDTQIQAVGRAEGSGTDTAFRVNVLGDVNASMDGTDVRKGQNQQVKTLVANSDNAIAYIALAFVEDGGTVPPIALEIDGTTYEYGKNLAAREYPLARDLHCYTYEGTSKKEAAFINMVLSDFGQQTFVESNNYVALTDDRQAEEREKLPEQTA